MTQDLLLGYDYDADPLTHGNRRAAKMLGWAFDADWHDHEDRDGFFVRGPYHDRPPARLDPAALK